MDINEFKKLPLLGIVRGVEESALEPLLEAVIAAGLKHLEITLNTAGALKLITNAAKISCGRLTIGAGTVLTVDAAKQAINSGATFIVSPVLIRDVVDYCVNQKICVFPGALTPQEIYNAWEAGATMVKVFPASFFGPSYFKEVKGPFNNIKLLACGGVKAENAGLYTSNGADALAFGGSIFSKERLTNKQFTLIERDVRALVGSLKK